MRPAILETLAEAGVTLWWDGLVLRYRAPVGAVDSAMYEAMRTARAAIIAAAEARGGMLLPDDRARWPSGLRREFEAEVAKLACDLRIPPAEVERRARVSAAGLWLRRQVGEGELP